MGIMICLLGAASVLHAQEYPTFSYGTPEYNLEPQNWQIAPVGDGRMAFANDGGLMIFDGQNWLKIEQELNYAARAVKLISNRLYVGGEDVFGFLKADSSGKPVFVSLTSELPDSLIPFGLVNRIFATRDYLLFEAGDRIFGFTRNHKFTRFFAFGSKITYMFSTDKTVYVQTEEGGLQALHEDRFLPVPSRQLFIDDPITGIIPEDEHHFLVITRSAKTYRLVVNEYGYERRLEEAVLNLPPEVAGSQLKSVENLYNGRLAFLLEEGGVVVWWRNQKRVRHFNKSSGLKDDYIEDIFADNRGLLWFALNNGISSVMWEYPVGGYHITQGLEGSVESIDRHQTHITASTSAGLFAIDAAKRETFNNFLPSQTWDVCSFDSDNLVVATNNDISVMRDETMHQIIECFPWKLKKSRIDPTTLWIGLDPGIAAARYTVGEWQSVPAVAGVEQAINKIFEDSRGHIWMGSSSMGIYRAQGFNWYGDSLALKSLLYYEAANGLPAGQVHVAEWRGRLRFATSDGYMVLTGDTFLPDTTLGIWPLTPLVHRIYQSPQKELWSVLYTDAGQFRIGFFQHPDSFEYKLFNPISREIFHSIYFDGDSIVWLGGPAGVYHYDRRMKFSQNSEYSVLITAVNVMDDSTIFFGFHSDSIGAFVNVQTEASIPLFHYKTNNISFQFAALSKGEGKDVRYSHILEGFDQKWSSWSNETKKEYTNLPPGTYTFRVVAQDIFECRSREATYSFVIEKPWYETSWYYMGQGAFLITLIFVTIFLNRSGEGGEWSAVITFVTIITIFEFVLLLLDPVIDDYADEVPIFKLVMNILLAVSLNPAEHFIKGLIARRKGIDYIRE